MVTRAGKGVKDEAATATAARKPRVSVKGEQTRARLVAAARSLLGGADDVPFTTRNVAGLAGVTHGMCHYHFKDRTDLILAVVEDIRPEWITPMEEAVGAPGSFDACADRVIALLAQPEAGELARIHAALHWFSLTDERVREALEGEYARWRACFVELFRVLGREREGGVDALTLGEALAAAADGLAAIQSLGSEVDARAVVRALVLGLAAGADRLTDARP
ncbi:TetR/AcrR family transcriptional regulator [Streptacidiphilus jiangxiensis]|uniref:DNA-binding transcriptional regulator, AcrR family n=1 Tax=Streptacidiphilus jiangxiensis TaxID=235985 RepID=A0A1H7YY48_STRJI|nr:TetR/AcrR family transcriptional regulator [Streptacidiphilus jiangxiensis]SEM51076.1 DNA-binding transcriptional regulator, AcrR family [Streptacidiphilus jiangxiensis]